MHPRLPACLLPIAFAAAGAAAQPADPPDDPVTVYRCVDADGHVTLGDVPCAKGTQEQVLAMQRPLDGQAPAAAPEPPPVTPAPTQPQVVVVRTPQPMYECVTPGGERYTSDTGDGNPRWVPLWTLGFRGGGRPGAGPVDNGATRAFNDHFDNRPLGGRVGAPTPRPPAVSGDRPDRPGRPPHRPGHRSFGGAGTWVRDTCHALPQGEVCARLVDRREEIRRRFFNAQETERNLLRTEERGINARLAADCGTS